MALRLSPLRRRLLPPAAPLPRTLARNMSASSANLVDNVNKTSHEFNKTNFDGLMLKRFFYAPAFEIYGGQYLVDRPFLASPTRFGLSSPPPSSTSLTYGPHPEEPSTFKP